jgi:hypothetical protein
VLRAHIAKPVEVKSKTIAILAHQDLIAQRAVYHLSSAEGLLIALLNLVLPQSVQEDIIALRKLQSLSNAPLHTIVQMERRRPIRVSKELTAWMTAFETDRCFVQMAHMTVYQVGLL